MAVTPITQDQIARYVVQFFDGHTPPRAAKIDVSDRQPEVTSPDTTIATIQSTGTSTAADGATLGVSPDGMTLTFDVISNLTGSATPISVNADANLASGQDTPLIVALDGVTVTPGTAGQAVTAQAQVNVLAKP